MAIETTSEILSPLSGGRQILEAARAQAASLLADARAHAAQLFAEARDDGFEAGKSAAASLLAEAAAIRGRALANVQSELAAVIETIATDVVGEELRTHPSSVAARIERALSSINSQHAVRLFVHPEILSAVREQLIGAPIPLVILEDPTLEIDDARIEAEGVTVLAAPKQHLQAILRALRNA